MNAFPVARVNDQKDHQGGNPDKEQHDQDRRHTDQPAREAGSPSSRTTRSESGFLLFDRAHWRQRIASTVHRARTTYALQELDLLATTSAADVPNVGLTRALIGIGYAQTGICYGNSVVGGKPVDTIQYLIPDPAEEAWRYLWRRPDDEIPSAFHAGRTRTHSARLEGSPSPLTR